MTPPETRSQKRIRQAAEEGGYTVSELAPSDRKGKKYTYMVDVREPVVPAKGSSRDTWSAGKIYFSDEGHYSGGYGRAGIDYNGTTIDKVCQYLREHRFAAAR